MRGPVTDFWGKFRIEQDGSCEWHPLVDHCADVASVAVALMSLPTWRARLDSFAGRPLSISCVSRLAVLAAVHDFGKFNVAFQAKARPELGGTAGHVREALGALDKPEVGDAFDPLGGWGDSVLGLLEAAICHHGQPYGLGDRRWQRSWWLPAAGLDPREGIDRLLTYTRAWFPAAFDVSAPPLPDVPAFTHAFAGLVMLADWIGSDTRFFPFSDGGSDRFGFAQSRASMALDHLSLRIGTPTRTGRSMVPPFERLVPGWVPNPAQSATLDLPLPPAGSVVVLESETGSGKTEAALARFVRMFEAGLVDGVYFALPTRSAATQMHERVVRAMERAFEAPPPVVLAVPGYIRVDDAEGTRNLPSFDVLWNDEARYRYRGWAAENPKRFLAGSVVVGTIDQVLLSSLMVSHAHLRATALLRHLLVIDEVHASDAYMTRITESVLLRQQQAGGHALLLSATLGGEARARLLNPLTGDSLSYAAAAAAPYPLLSSGGRSSAAIAIPAEVRKRSISIRTRPMAADPAAVAAVALDAARAGAKVLIVRNTVTDCLATQAATEVMARARGLEALLFTCAGKAAPHHSRYARRDRRALDHAIEREYGRNRTTGPTVVVATQTVQQSLDLDADFVITDLCPADVLLQRLGRLHRHRRARPESFESASAVVITPGERNLSDLLTSDGRAKGQHGLGSVYRDLRVLEATWRQIESHPTWVIPDMNRALVEGAVHSTVLESVARELGGRWPAHSAVIMGEVFGHARHAALNLVDWTQPYADYSFRSGPDERIGTRLGEFNRRVVFREEPAGPFGARVDELQLLPWWLRSGSEADEPVDVRSEAEGFSFGFAEKRFRYDRLGVRPMASDNDGAHDDGP